MHLIWAPYGKRRGSVFKIFICCRALNSHIRGWVFFSFRFVLSCFCLCICVFVFFFVAKRNLKFAVRNIFSFSYIIWSQCSALIKLCVYCFCCTSKLVGFTSLCDARYMHFWFNFPAYCPVLQCWNSAFFVVYIIPCSMWYRKQQYDSSISMAKQEKSASSTSCTSYSPGLSHFDKEDSFGNYPLHGKLDSVLGFAWQDFGDLLSVKLKQRMVIFYYFLLSCLFHRV